MNDHILINVIILLGTAVFIVAILKRFRLSPVLGYLIAGAAIGDHGLKIVTYDQTKLLGELGVVFLLFAIGLELSFERLKAMRRYVFGLGSLQVLTTAIVIAGAMVLIDGNSSAAIITGGGLALSSTALVMQVIDENRSQSTQIGRISLAILLLQDLAVVPLLVIVPLLASNNKASLAVALGIAFLKAVTALLTIFIVGRVLLRPVFSFISSESNNTSELPISMTLLIVLSAAWATETFGLSLALGAFVAGVLVAETEFRLQAEESIYPFKSLFLGLFFMTVGMNIDALEMYEKISHILTLSIALICIKTLIITAFCILFGFNKGVAFYSGLLLSQGGEFGFILFSLGKDSGVLEESTADILLLVVTFTMALTPLLAALGKKIAEKVDKGLGKTPTQMIELGARDLTNHIIIAGLGNTGKMVARVLEAEGISYVILDLDDDRVKEELSNGLPVFKGDVSQADTLKALGTERAFAIILTMNNQVTIKKSLKTISSNYQDIPVVVKLKNLKNAREFYDLGATTIIPESYETGLQIGGTVLKNIGISEQEINRIKVQFRLGNYIIAKKEDALSEVEDND
ncbi:monovalent cation:proton antiporter-2 (CPA2) family protein [Rickettsia prowazekii]|uniref:GLUTATHIONE-REGULATED POTASSIUM-EFFLUX SYSTEM PROTEIN KEFB (KefB) n=2 Tax=Rickettsia prowazekii TaxID=782 RepID=Q9ZCE6_RICPR|nr:monovalent cation:proton antiporter-2 (CPA2) family protein [Rickettsia prowazekii]ADE30376.1 Glutathione-regulated potassium-efflux system protein KefB [Rickettsia prowazekii str. Rp22]AFE49605.1 glutathione-regulated potassium-efflux system protein KEFB (kefB) [Rickettsia prowazekii str. Chernikova]AFE50449.1 glutathione-regulated potassium-efflux system protein KEFB (kefB) [Rickettsia prowazekii str. Katsinyian]AFE51293.1 glutathione-regulated potassium-efflux system protein KEFB (kefB) [